MISSPGSTSRIVFGAQQIEGAGFGGEDEDVGRAVLADDAAHGERAEAARIAGGEDAVARHHDDGEGAVDLRERVGDGVDQRGGLRVRDELDDDLGVGGGLEEGALALELGADVAEVDQVAVVRDGDEALGGLDADGLRVEQRGVAGGGVAGVADGEIAGELLQDFVGEDVGDQAHALDVREVMAVGGGDAGGLLPAMLQRVEHEVDLARGFGVGVDGDYAAFFVQGVGVVLVARSASMRTREVLRSHARDALVETLGHAVTVSTLRVDWRALDQASAERRNCDPR